MRKLIILTLTALASSCISNNESSGIDEILEFYGGRVEYSIGANASTEDELQGKFFELKMMDVDFDKYFKGNYRLPASNIAYLYYKNLDELERDDYSFVRVVLTGNSSEHTFEFSTDQLEQVRSLMPIMDSTVELLTEQDYLGLIATFHPLLISNSDSSKYTNEQLEIDQQYGKVTGFSLQGFKSTQLDVQNSTLNCLRISGVLLREIQKTDFSITIETDRQSNAILGIRYAK